MHINTRKAFDAACLAAGVTVETAGADYACTSPHNGEKLEFMRSESGWRRVMVGGSGKAYRSPSEALRAMV